MIDFEQEQDYSSANGESRNALNGALTPLCLEIRHTANIFLEIEGGYMGSAETDITTIPVRKQDHRKAKEVKRDGETWSLFLRRATEELDSETED